MLCYELAHFAQGGFATLHCGTFAGEEVAAKRFRAERTARVLENGALGELTRLSHHNLVRILYCGCDGAPAGERCLWLVMEKALESVTERLISGLKHGFRPPCTMVTAWCRQLCAGVAHLHDQGLIHCDLTTCNLLLFKQHRAPPVLKVADLDTVHVKGEPTPNGTPGTIHYLDPRYCRGRPPPDEHRDVWALGVCLCRMLCGLAPPTGLKACWKDPSASLRLPQGAPEAFRAVLEPCWAPLAKRPRAAAVGHMFTQEWVQSVDPAKYVTVVLAPPDPDDAELYKGP
eukprot:TRINITY_DN32408_c0_g1_i2.p3 TRINITY_DN32408_c0_g1~~TRINITY_DN32408_c0_g1_i2.p3  ORF type:complete len:287 (+),score=62.74 TRINITY_DN32408_c0_g1_i2:1055-1915(+)